MAIGTLSAQHPNKIGPSNAVVILITNAEVLKYMGNLKPSAFKHQDGCSPIHFQWLTN